MNFTTVLYCVILYCIVLYKAYKGIEQHYIVYFSKLKTLYFLNIGEAHGKTDVHFFRILIYCIYLAPNVTGRLLNT